MARLASHPDAYRTFTPTDITDTHVAPPIESLPYHERQIVQAEAWGFVITNMHRITGIARRVCGCVPGDQREEAIEHVKIKLVEHWPRLRILVSKARAPEKMETTVITMTAQAVARSWDRRRRFGAAHVKGDISIDAPFYGDDTSSLHEKIASTDFASDEIAEAIGASTLSEADRALVFELMADCTREERAAMRAYLAGEESRAVVTTLRRVGARNRAEWGACFAA